MSCRKNAYGIIGKKGHYSFGTMKVMAVIQFEFSCFYFLCNFMRLLSVNHEVYMNIYKPKPEQVFIVIIILARRK